MWLWLSIAAATPTSAVPSTHTFEFDPNVLEHTSTAVFQRMVRTIEHAAPGAPLGTAPPAFVKKNPERTDTFMLLLATNPSTEDLEQLLDVWPSITTPSVRSEAERAISDQVLVFAPEGLQGLVDLPDDVLARVTERSLSALPLGTQPLAIQDLIHGLEDPALVNWSPPGAGDPVAHGGYQDNWASALAGTSGRPLAALPEPAVPRGCLRTPAGQHPEPHGWLNGSVGAVLCEALGQLPDGTWNPLFTLKQTSAARRVGSRETTTWTFSQRWAPADGTLAYLQNTVEVSVGGVGWSELAVTLPDSQVGHAVNPKLKAWIESWVGTLPVSYATQVGSNDQPLAEHLWSALALDLQRRGGPK